MNSEKEAALENIKSITSAGRFDLEDHEVNLQAIASVPLGLEEVGQQLALAQKDLILKRLDLNGLVSMDDLPLTATFMIEKVEKMSIDEAILILEESLIEFENDVNIPMNEYDFYEKLVAMRPQMDEDSLGSSLDEKLKSGVKVNEVDPEVSSSSSSEDFSGSSPFQVVDWKLQTKLEAALIAYYSPYQEVRAVTDPYDDPTIPVETLRVYFLGIIWVCISAFVNQFFNDRFPGISLSSNVVQMLLYPCGKAMEYIVPKWKFKVWKYTIDLNPGPWTYKEQILCSLMSAVGGGTSYVGWNITAQKLPFFYGNTWVTMGYQILLLLCTNFMGIGFAGILRKFVVYPSRAVWQELLPTLALNRALLQPEKKENINGWTISSYKFFFIKPDNLNLAVITGSQLGLGFNPIASFDWNVILYRSPLTTPFYATINLCIGSFISFFIILGVYYSNFKWTKYLPINSNGLFTNTGDPYQVRNVVNSDSLFDKEKYEQYGPPYYTAGNLVLYGAFFAIYPFAIVHEIAMTYKPLWATIKNFGSSLKDWRKSTYEGQTDPHSIMMRKYKEVPDWVFIIVLLLSIMCAILCAELYPTNTPVWAIFFAIGINFVFLIPITTLYATTNFSFGLNVLVELIMGYALPGNGLALMFIKALGYNIDGQAQNYITDQKMGHYAKIPPRAMFRIQMFGVFIGTFINLAALNFKLNHVEDYCTPHQKQKFSCPSSRTFFSSSVIWGVIGPKKVFNGLYPMLQWCFLIGFLLAIPCIVIKLYGPKRYVKYFQPALIIGGMLNWAPYNLSYYTGGLYTSIAFMWYIKNKYAAFWNKYNYVLNSALSAGVAFSSIIIFFAVQYHAKDVNWWGNSVYYAGIDGGNGIQAHMNATVSAPEGYFGPRFGHLP
ncbi:OPT-domain-containing protein [Suhomyces tanzawaensis NRRL Y-17324]|uniref:OPT-domain-containing protein n=1 Tax=Suhomyces tanzawaensis NRRL Y-17324 TaxID=984487 RepID=A0A1E4SK29_9ASCO|nr:OPT-domain-containing protein [Suhomyces tanzawaensis NRRL Y-17324]ODV79854.1 OPT-domain-containing protein [Suhomyces tanzawaensis NRRL Y-17324]